MNPSFSVVIGTFGDPEWMRTAQRALESVDRQTVAPISTHLVHDETLAIARNEGALLAAGSHLIFLDADDELDEHYIEAMSEAITDNSPVLCQPSTLGIVNGKADDEPVLIPERPLDKGNFLVIGTAVDRATCLSVGGFDEWPIAEDWAFFIKCWQAGATVKKVPEAIYRVHVNPKGRNAAPPAMQREWFNKIHKRYFKGESWTHCS